MSNEWAGDAQDICKINYLHEAVNLMKSLAHQQSKNMGRSWHQGDQIVDTLLPEGGEKHKTKNRIHKYPGCVGKLKEKKYEKMDYKHIGQYVTQLFIFLFTW